MGILQLKQLRLRLSTDVVPLIDVGDLEGHGDDHVEKNALSRAVAAFSTAKLWGWEIPDAVDAVTDGPGDNGVDLVAVDPHATRVMLVQSKWHEGSGSMAKTDLLAFKKGVDDLLNDRRSSFSGAIHERWEEIQTILLDPTVRLDLVCAHTGSGPLGEEVADVMKPLMENLNEFEEVASFRYLAQAQLHGFLTSVADPIELDVQLSDWGVMEGPARAFYGHVAAADVASWHHEHGVALFTSNLRSTLPDSSVNDGIRRTLTEAPEHFWYFNNGITALCTKIGKSPGGANDRRLGWFRFTGVQVVNGAQTVGSIANSIPDNPSDGLTEGAGGARVLVRFIELEGTGEGFASDVTRWTNTQNRVGGRDFLALDPEQARIASEFAIDDRSYVYRSGQSDPALADGCGVQEATVALACASPDIRLAVLAKREVSRLWADIEKAPYKALFNAGTTAHKVWIAVQVLRCVESHLDAARSGLDGRQRSMLTHLNRVAVWLAQRRLASVGHSLDSEWGDVQAVLNETVPELAISLATTADEEYQGYPANLAKNATECERISGLVLQSL